MEKCIPIIKSGKTFIFTNWLNFGVSVIKKILDKENISFALISGDVNMTERYEIIDKFNNNEFDTLIITRAGGEGISLMEVRNVIVLDPTWNYASIYQIIGRAIRFQSHINLPKEEQHVKVHLLVAQPPDFKENNKSDSGDSILYQIMSKKQEQNEKLLIDFKKIVNKTTKYTSNNQYVKDRIKKYNEFSNKFIK